MSESFGSRAEGYAVNRGMEVHWKLKAIIQNAVSLLPSDVSYEAYYRLQRKYGGLRFVSPIVGMEDGIRIVDGIEKAGRSVEQRVFLEVGTGRTVSTPIALWLSGAARVITIDLNPYLKRELIEEEINYIREHQDSVKAMFSGRPDQDGFLERFNILLEEKTSVDEFLKKAGIEYVAPADGRRLPIKENTVDYHISNNVFEHISPADLQEILVEGKRVIKEDGLLVHRVDFSDHFSHNDRKISSINFLQYSERQWLRYAGNRYMYHNRLRIDEIQELIADTDLSIVLQECEVDQNAVRQIESGLKLAPRFAGKPKEVNATDTALLVVSKIDVAAATPQSNRSNRPVLSTSAARMNAGGNFTGRRQEGFADPDRQGVQLQ